MTRPLNLDRDKAAAIVAEALELRPELRDQLARYQASGQHWTVRSVLNANETITLAVKVDSRAAVAVWHGPRELVELPEPGRGLH